MTKSVKHRLMKYAEQNGYIAMTPVNQMELDMIDYNEDKMMNIPFSPPDISDLEINEVVDTLRSGWITTGPKVKKLEAFLADYVGVNRCACLNSQTACGEMSLRLLGIKPGDEVITCAYTFTATASVVDHLGAKLVLIDCQKDRPEMDYDVLESAINEKTKAIIPIDIGGIPCDYNRIYDIVEKKKHLFHAESELQGILGRIAVVADAAHALGAKIKINGKWKMIGSVADFTNFSFHTVKNFTTAEGGMISWCIPGVDDESIYHQIMLYSLHGQSKDALAKFEAGVWEYDIIGPWYKCNMTDIMGAIGLAQFKRYPDMLKRRREIIDAYDQAFQPLGIDIQQHYSDDFVSSGHLYLTRVPGINRAQRDQIIEKMGTYGISVNVHYKPLPMFTAYKKMGFNIADFPNAYHFFENEITLPLYTKLTDEEVNYIIRKYIDAVRDYL